MNRYLLSLGLTLCLTLSVPAAAGAQRSAPGPAAAAARAPDDVVQGELGRRLDLYVSRLAAYGLSGALLVASHGEVVLHKGYGLADRERAVPVGAETPFLIGSLAKQFTAAAILKLEEQGRLSTGDRLAKFFPSAPADKAEITLHQLLTHTAGLPYLAPDFMAPAARAEVMREMLALPLQAEPGQGYAYSNPGYTLLAGVVEQASGETFETYLRENLFAPAGMARTGFMGEPRWAELTDVRSYSGSTDEGPLPGFPALPRGVGAGTVISTAGDLHRWERALRDGRVLSAASVAKFFTPYVATGQGAAQYAYGWNVVTTPRGTRLVTHGGDLGGYNAGYRRYVDEDLVVIFLSNARGDGPGYRDALLNPLGLLVAGMPYPAPPELTAVDSAALARHAGRYRTPAGGVLTVRAAPQGLRVTGWDQEALALVSGAPAESEATARALNARTDSLARALAGGDAGLLRAYAHPGFPVAGHEQGLIAHFRGEGSPLGAHRGVEVLGTAVTSPMTARSFVWLRFEKGTTVASVGWVGGRLTVIGHDLSEPVPALFAPTAAGTFAAFDLFTGTRVELSAVAAADGETRALRFTTPAGGTVEAARID